MAHIHAAGVSFHVLGPFLISPGCDEGHGSSTRDGVMLYVTFTCYMSMGKILQRQRVGVMDEWVAGWMDVDVES
jgi:hypothetical protein